MRKLVISLTLLFSGLVVMSQPTTQLEPPIPADSFNLNLDSVRIYMLEFVNELRAKYHKKPLQYDSILNVCALNHAVYLTSISWNEASHTQKDTKNKYFTGKTPVDRCGVYGGENIAGDFWYKKMTMKQITKSLFESWEESPGHKENMLNGRYTMFGFAIVLRKRFCAHCEKLYGYDVDAVQTFY